MACLVIYIFRLSYILIEFDLQESKYTVNGMCIVLEKYITLSQDKMIFCNNHVKIYQLHCLVQKEM